MAENIFYTDKIDQQDIQDSAVKISNIREEADREIRREMRYQEYLTKHMGEELNFYQIWVEGYLCTGMKSPEKARCLGVWPGRDFYDACCTYNFVMTDPDAHNPQIDIHPDSRTASMWACRLFDNKEDAVKAFG